MLPPCASTLADIASLVGAVTTLGLLVAAVFAGRVAKQQVQGLTDQLVLQRGIERRQRVFEHLGQLFDRDFIVMSTEAQRLFKAHPKDPDDWQKVWGEKSDEEKSMIAATMNFYEVVAGEYNDPQEELLDKPVADKALIAIADAMWLQAEPFVLWLRDAYKDRRAYEEWERLHDVYTAAQYPGGHPDAVPVPPEALSRPSRAGGRKMTLSSESVFQRPNLAA